MDYALSLERGSIYTDENLHGAYNVSDRNRVGAAINRIISEMNLLGLRAKDDWNEYDIVKVPDNANTLACLARLQQVLPFGAATAVPMNLDSLSYQKANDIERVLYETGSAWLWVSDSAMFAGDGYASSLTESQKFDQPNQQVSED